MASKRIYEAKIWAAGIYAAGIWRGLGVEAWTPPSNCPITTAVTMPANSITTAVTMTANSITTGITMPANTISTDVGIGCGYQD